MADLDKELGDLRREIVEARNQGIKTDNQIKNLALDIKGFERRFDTLERRTRIASLGAHAIVALAVAIAAVVVTSMRTGTLQKEIVLAKEGARSAEAAAAQKMSEAETRVKAADEQRARELEARRVASTLVEHLDAKREREAAELLPSLRLEDLDELGKKLLGPRVTELRDRAADAAYKSGKLLAQSGKLEAAVPELSRALRLDPNGRVAEQTRYFLGMSLLSLRRYDQAEPILRELAEKTKDRALQEEARLYLATCLARLDQRDEAKSLFRGLVAGRHQGTAKVYLAALDAGTALPDDGPKKAIPKPAAPSPTPAPIPMLPPP